MLFPRITSRPEFRLALSITGTVLAVLVWVVLIALCIAFFTDINRQEELFRARQEMIESRPGFLETFKRPRALPSQERHGMNRRFMPSMLRNIIVLSRDGSIDTLGPLENISLSSEALGGLKENTIEERIIGEEEYTLYAFSLEEKTVILYEPTELLKGPRGIAFFSIFWSIILFSILLFFLSIRIARKVIDPIQDLAEKERAYARHIAHELKTPLSVIKSDLELARALPDEADGRISSAIVEVSSLGSVIDDLLLLSAGDSGIDKKPVDLGRMVRELTRASNGHALAWEIVGEGHATVEGDERLLRTLLKNLVANVRSHAVPDSTAIVRFEQSGFVFKNTAENVPEIIKRRVFEPFVGTPGKWSGLGLSLVKRIADLHGWRVTFEVKDGQAQTGIWF